MMEHINRNLQKDEIEGRRAHRYCKYYQIERVPPEAIAQPLEEEPPFPIKLKVASRSVVRGRTTHDDPWWMLGFMTTEDKTMSELSIEQTLGGPLRTAFVVPGCTIMRSEDFYPNCVKETILTINISDLKLVNHKLLQFPGASAPKPDFATVLKATREDAIGPEPIFVFGEVKREQTGIAKYIKAMEAKNNTVPLFTAQMQAAIHPILVMKIREFIHKQTTELEDAKAQLPSDSYVYGVYMDEKSVSVWVHLPVFIPNDQKWIFVQAHLVTYTIPSFGESLNEVDGRSHNERGNAVSRLKLLLGLITVRARAVYLKKRFTENGTGEVWEQIVASEEFGQ